MRTVGQALVQGLALRGVSLIFGIPGVHTIELYRGLAGSGIRHVTPRHEQGAGFMADGYARVSGKPGVAFVITGPGLTNTLTAMAQARADSVPVLVVSGVNRLSAAGQGLGMLHELPDQAAMVRTLCPSFQVTGPDVLEHCLNQAFDAMLSGRPGPAHIEVPTDVMAMQATTTPTGPLPRIGTRLPDAVRLNAAADLLNHAQRPVILAGGGTRAAGAALQTLAERLDAPVVQTTNARGNMHAHPLTVPASASLNAVRGLIEASDQVLAIGTELGLTDYDMYARGGLPDLSGMIRIDCSDAQLAHHTAALTLQGDAGEVMAHLARKLPPADRGGATRAAGTRSAAFAEIGGYMRWLHGFTDAIRRAVPQALIIGDSTQLVYAGNLYYDHDRAGGWFNAATGYGALGFGPGAAIGAALAAPGTPVICILGDGGLQFSPAELRVAVDENLPVTFVIWNNSGYGEIAQSMSGAQTDVIGCTPSPLNHSAFAAACDLPYTHAATTPDALYQALAAPCAGPRLIEITAGMTVI